MAAGLAAELEKALGVKAKLIPGSGGIFDVALDREIIYSKAETGRFPEPGEIPAAIRKLHPEVG